MAKKTQNNSQCLSCQQLKKNAQCTKHEALKLEYFLVYRIKNFIYSSKLISVLLPLENE